MTQDCDRGGKSFCFCFSVGPIFSFRDGGGVDRVRHLIQVSFCVILEP